MIHSMIKKPRVVSARGTEWGPLGGWLVLHPGGDAVLGYAATEDEARAWAAALDGSVDRVYLDAVAAREEEDLKTAVRMKAYKRGFDERETLKAGPTGTLAAGSTPLVRPAEAVPVAIPRENTRVIRKR